MRRRPKKPKRPNDLSGQCRAAAEPLQHAVGAIRRSPNIPLSLCASMGNYEPLFVPGTHPVHGPFVQVRCATPSLLPLPPSGVLWKRTPALGFAECPMLFGHWPSDSRASAPIEEACPLARHGFQRPPEADGRLDTRQRLEIQVEPSAGIILGIPPAEYGMGKTAPCGRPAPLPSGKASHHALPAIRTAGTTARPPAPCPQRGSRWCQQADRCSCLRRDPRASA